MQFTRGRPGLVSHRFRRRIGRFRECQVQALIARYLIEKASQPGAVVLDPFMGSVSTLVAARKAGRRAIGIEVEKRYCKIAAERLESAAV